MGMERQTNIDTYIHTSYIHTYTHTHTHTHTHFLLNNFRNQARTHSRPMAGYGHAPGLKINLYSNYAENKLQVLTFASITFVCITAHCWNLA